METTVGIVGPHDLVDDVAAICEEQPGVRVHRFDYDHESLAAGLVNVHASAVDAWLFTGVVPYTLAESSLTRPAVYVDYSGATLLQAMVRLLREGHDVTRISVDTLDPAQVRAVLSEAAVPTGDVKTMPYRPGTTSEQFSDFHRKYAAAHGGEVVAITCLASVYNALSGEVPAFRLAPSATSVRHALHQLLLATNSQVQEDAQIALGLVEGDDPARLASDLAHEVGPLGGSLSQVAGGPSLIVTTRGPLSDATSGLTRLPMLSRLAHRHSTVRVGFGLGRSGAEAERLARRALSRARKHGPVAAVVSMRNDLDLVLDAETAQVGSTVEQSRSVLASRVGLSTATLDRLHDLVADVDDGTITTRDVAEGLGIQLRTARRMLQRLEMAGLAERSGRLSSHHTGRPLELYRVSL